MNGKTLFPTVKLQENKRLKLWKATTRNNRGDLIVIHGKTKGQAKRFAEAIRTDENRRLKTESKSTIKSRAKRRISKSVSVRSSSRARSHRRSKPRRS